MNPFDPCGDADAGHPDADDADLEFDDYDPADDDTIEDGFSYGEDLWDVY